MTRDAPAGFVNHWSDWNGGPNPRFACSHDREHCRSCGRELVETFELTGSRSRRTGEPTFARYHSCPTWVDEGWQTRWWARRWACPGMGHDSHDADNPLSARGYY
jgi:hypothetical protein